MALCKQQAHQSTQNHIKRKWIRDVGCMHEGTMHDIRQATGNTYLQTFHYRIINRIISTNTFLYRIGKFESPMCTFCNEDSETLYHILWECKIVKDYLKDIATYLNDEYSLTINFTVQSWIFPRLADESRLNILIFTLAKQVIFRARYESQRPRKDQFHFKLKREAENENKSAVRHKSIDKFLSKWGNVSKIVSENNP